MICTHCKTSFEIVDQDRVFYKKMDVPEPRYCPSCRRQRMLCWRNQRVLYSRKCDGTGKPMISIFAPESTYKVYDRDYWWSDKWDATSYGMDFDFTKTFAEQYDTLLHRVPMAGIFLAKSEHCAFCNHTGEAKNCYLVNASWGAEDSLYSEQLIGCKDCVEVLQAQKCENCYEVVGCTNCYNTKYSLYSERCIDSWFLYDCKDCTSCIGCTNLRKKSYYIFNKPYSKEEYEKKVKELALNTRAGLQAATQKFVALRVDAIHRFATLINCENTTGDNLTGLVNSHDCFGGQTAQDSAYCTNFVGPMSSLYEGYGVGAEFDRGYYMFDAGVKGMDYICCGIVYGCSFAYYSYNCHSSYEIFGCSGIRNKKYCILNKEYSKEEYMALKAKIIEHMRSTGEWGEFFPPAIAPFGYNESLAADYVELSKEQALAGGFKWQDKVPGTFGKETIKAGALPERIAEVPATITQELLACVDCGKNYKIIAQELSYYQKRDLPLPIKCPDCRLRGRMALRNPHQLWHRQCMCTFAEHDHYANDGLCRNEFETIYAPDRPEKVFCESCYQKEVL